jgi:hypothetical protein
VAKVQHLERVGIGQLARRLQLLCEALLEALLRLVRQGVHDLHGDPFVSAVFGLGAIQGTPAPLGDFLQESVASFQHATQELVDRRHARAHHRA